MWIDDLATLLATISTTGKSSSWSCPSILTKALYTVNLVSSFFELNFFSLVLYVPMNKPQKYPKCEHRFVILSIAILECWVFRRHRLNQTHKDCWGCSQKNLIIFLIRFFIALSSRSFWTGSSRRLSLITAISLGC